MNGKVHGRGGLAFAFTAGAFCWALAAAGGAFVVPAYRGITQSSEDPSSVTHTYSSTLVDENGLGVLIPLSIPIILVGLVWFALHRRCSRGSPWAGQAAWTVILALWLFALLTGATIGAFFLPMVAMLVAAAVLTPLPAGR